MSREGCVLAFDFGLKHIGVAVGQTVTATAAPLTTLSARNGKPDWEYVEQLVDEWRPVRLIVGLPLNMDGTESEMSATARRFGERLARHTGTEVDMVDERLTTREAGETVRFCSTGGQSVPAESHAAAAALIAETWLSDGSTDGS